MAGKKPESSKGHGGPSRQRKKPTSSAAARPAGVRKRKTIDRHGTTLPSLKLKLEQAPDAVHAQVVQSTKSERKPAGANTAAEKNTVLKKKAALTQQSSSIPCNRAGVRTGAASKVIEQSTTRQLLDNSAYEQDIVIEQKYADPYERPNPTNDKCFDEQRRLNLCNNLRAQGYTTNMATSIAAWLMRCNGRWQPWQIRRQKSTRPTDGSRSRRRTPSKGISKNATPATITGSDAEPGDDSSVQDTSEAGLTSDMQQTDTNPQASLDAIQTALAQAQRTLSIFHKVYGPSGPNPNPALEIVYWPTHISKTPRALPRPDQPPLRRRPQPLTKTKIYAAHLNFPRNEAHDDAEEVEVWTEDPLFGDSVASSHLLTWTERIEAKKARQTARERVHTATNASEIEEHECSVGASVGGSGETQPPQPSQAQTSTATATGPATGPATATGPTDWETAELAACRIFASAKPSQPQFWTPAFEKQIQTQTRTIEVDGLANNANANVNVSEGEGEGEGEAEGDGSGIDADKSGMRLARVVRASRKRKRGCE